MEEVVQACEAFEELRRAYDTLRAEHASIRRDEAAHGCRRKFEDGPGVYTSVF